MLNQYLSGGIRAYKNFCSWSASVLKYQWYIPQIFAVGWDVFSILMHKAKTESAYPYSFKQFIYNVSVTEFVNE